MIDHQGVMEQYRDNNDDYMKDYNINLQIVNNLKDCKQGLPNDYHTDAVRYVAKHTDKTKLIPE